MKLSLVLDDNYKFRFPVTLRVFPSVLHYCNRQKNTREQASYDRLLLGYGTNHPVT